MEHAVCVCVDVVNMLRVGFNDLCHNHEAWQLVAYTIAFCHLLAWIQQLIGPLALNPALFGIFRVVRSTPWVRRKVDGEMERVKQEMEEEVHQNDKARDFYKFLPEHRASPSDILSEAEQYVQMTNDRKVVSLSTEKTLTSELYNKMFDLFRGADATRSHLYPGSRKMETEIVRMVSSLFHASSDSCGVVVGEPTEALMLACIAYRNDSFRRGAVRPCIVAPATASPVLDKAASLFQMTVVRIPVDDNGEYKEAAVRRAMAGNSNVCMVIACAPNPVTGVMDPIEKIAEITHNYRIPLHIDCSLGGFLLPFMEHCDYQSPAFDFRLPGVTSISVDLQENGQSPCPCGVLIYRDASYIRDQCFVKGVSATGPYATSTIKDIRDGATIATAWATLLLNGRDGYLDACHRVIQTTRQLTEMLKMIEGVVIRGYGNMCLVAFSHETVDIYDVVDTLVQKGWDVDPLLHPMAARVRVTPCLCEDGQTEVFVQDVATAIHHLTRKPSPKRTRLSAQYHMMKSVSDASLVDDVVFLKLMAHYSVAQAPERRTRTLSVEGRKISMMQAAQEAAKLAQEVRARGEVNKIN